MAKTVTVRIDESTYKRIKSAADSERRTISNFMEYATLSYVENRTFVDNDEMRGISADKDLVATLSQSDGRYKAQKVPPCLKSSESLKLRPSRSDWKPKVISDTTGN